MAKIIYSIRDIKVSAWQVPFFSDNEISAIRGIQMHMQNGQSALTEFAADYELYEMGSFDENSGNIYVLDQPKFIISCYTIQSNMLKSIQLRQKLNEAAVADANEKK